MPKHNLKFRIHKMRPPDKKAIYLNNIIFVCYIDMYTNGTTNVVFIFKRYFPIGRFPVDLYYFDSVRILLYTFLYT